MELLIIIVGLILLVWKPMWIIWIGVGVSFVIALLYSYEKYYKNRLNRRINTFPSLYASHQRQLISDISTDITQIRKRIPRAPKGGTGQSPGSKPKNEVIKSSIVESKITCGWCKEEIANKQTVVCSSCKTSMHTECLIEFGSGCPTAGCSNNIEAN